MLKKEHRLFRDIKTREIVLLRKEPNLWGNLIPQLWAEMGRIPATNANIDMLCDLVINGVTPEQQYNDEEI